MAALSFNSEQDLSSTFTVMSLDIGYISPMSNLKFQQSITLMRSLENSTKSIHFFIQHAGTSQIFRALAIACLLKDAAIAHSFSPNITAGFMGYLGLPSVVYNRHFTADALNAKP